MRLDLTDLRVLKLLEGWGAPYIWAAGSPGDTHRRWPQGGGDCSGWAQNALVILGILSPTATDRAAHALAYACDPIREGNELIGDLSFYGSEGDRGGSTRITHCMVVIGPGVVIGASGGGRTTRGDDPRAYVKLERLHYRADFITIGRLKASERGA